jgi:hypothetical protein
MNKFKTYLSTLDQDQKDTLLSTLIIVALVLLISRSSVVILDLFLFPAIIQGLITFAFFVRKPLKAPD